MRRTKKTQWEPLTGPHFSVHLSVWRRKEGTGPGHGIVRTDRKCETWSPFGVKLSIDGVLIFYKNLRIYLQDMSPKTYSIQFRSIMMVCEFFLSFLVRSLSQVSYRTNNNLSNYTTFYTVHMYSRSPFSWRFPSTKSIPTVIFSLFPRI